MKILIVSGFWAREKQHLSNGWPGTSISGLPYWKMNMEPQESTAHVLARTGKERRKMYGK